MAYLFDDAAAAAAPLSTPAKPGSVGKVGTRPAGPNKAKRRKTGAKDNADANSGSGRGDGGGGGSKAKAKANDGSGNGGAKANAKATANGLGTMAASGKPDFPVHDVTMAADDLPDEIKLGLTAAINCFERAEEARIQGLPPACREGRNATDLYTHSASCQGLGPGVVSSSTIAHMAGGRADKLDAHAAAAYKKYFTLQMKAVRISTVHTTSLKIATSIPPANSSLLANSVPPATPIHCSRRRVLTPPAFQEHCLLYISSQQFLYLHIYIHVCVFSLLPPPPAPQHGLATIKQGETVRQYAERLGRLADAIVLAAKATAAPLGFTVALETLCSEEDATAIKAWIDCDFLTFGVLAQFFGHKKEICPHATVTSKASKNMHAQANAMFSGKTVGSTRSGLMQALMVRPTAGDDVEALAHNVKSSITVQAFFKAGGSAFLIANHNGFAASQLASVDARIAIILLEGILTVVEFESKDI